VQEVEGIKPVKGSRGKKKSTHTNGHTITGTLPLMPVNKTIDASNAIRTSELEQQFKNVNEEYLTSLRLLNSSGAVLLTALERMIPPEDSVRAIGEYTGKALNKVSKGICELARTKSDLIRTMFQISRDGK